MTTPLDKKSSLDEMQSRFDEYVHRYADIETGQTSVDEAPLLMELITSAAIRTTANIRRVLDIGCGAGNNAVKLAQTFVRSFDCDLVDLSLPMLEKARERLSAMNRGQIRVFHGDFRTAELPQEHYDVIIAAAVLHHLRDDEDWEKAFSKMFRLTAKGGSLWVTDLICHETEAIQGMMEERYGGYLSSVGGDEFKEAVFACIDVEDSPRPVAYQMELLRNVGFRRVELLHKNSCFAAFGAVKSD